MMITALIVVLAVFLFHKIPINEKILEPLTQTKPIIGWVLLTLYYWVAVILGVWVAGKIPL